MKPMIGIFISVAMILSAEVFAAAATGGARGDGAAKGGGGAEYMTAIVVDSDSLVAGIDRYAGRRVETSGTIIHVCGVDGTKMRLRTAGNSRIKIVPGEGMAAFDKDTYHMKKIRVRGLVREARIDEKYIEGIERDRSLLCHVDHTPCISKSWAEEAKAAGTADSISAVGTNKLRERLAASAKGYISVVTIVADSCEVTGDAEK